MTFVINLVEHHRRDILSPMRQQFLETPVVDKDFRFVFNAEKNCHFDMLISYGNFFNDNDLNLPKHRCVFVTPEPPEWIVFPRKYLEQYGFVVTPFEDVYKLCTNVLNSHAFLPWMYDWDSFHSIVSTQNLPQQSKKNKVSAIISAKNSTLPQSKRLELVQKLKNILGDKLDIYGNGFKNIRKKSSALKPYKYHLAIENSHYQNHWTEKISDAYLGGCLPFYYGCKNIDQFFNPDSFILIDIDDADKTAQIILKAIEEDTATKRIKNIEESTKRLYQKYNAPAEMIKIAKYILEKEKIFVGEQKNTLLIVQNTSLIVGTSFIRIKIRIFLRKKIVKIKFFIKKILLNIISKSLHKP